MIDSHVHFWNYNPVKEAWINEDMLAIRKDFRPLDLAEKLKENGVLGCVAVQADQSEAETDFLLAYAKEYSFIKGVVGWIDLKADNLPERLFNFVNQPNLKGWRHIAQPEPAGFLTSKAFLRGIAELQQYQHTYDILIHQSQLNDAIILVEKFPSQKFVLDHLGKPNIKTQKDIELWRNGVKILSQNKNVYAKLSGLVTETDWLNWKYNDFTFYLDTMFECFGAERLMFGSDWPVCTLASDYSSTKEVINRYAKELTLDEKKAVFESTATSFYRL
ncbi:MAG: amidohydrolase [Flavobacterium sp.]|nr:MAG: amidohydrolase [Flavobacterium sp.]